MFLCILLISTTVISAEEPVENLKPEVQDTIILDEYYNIDDTINFSIQVSDPENDDLSFTWYVNGVEAERISPLIENIGDYNFGVTRNAVETKEIYTSYVVDYGKDGDVDSPTLVIYKDFFDKQSQIYWFSEFESNGAELFEYNGYQIYQSHPIMDETDPDNPVIVGYRQYTWINNGEGIVVYQNQSNIPNEILDTYLEKYPSDISNLEENIVRDGRFLTIATEELNEVKVEITDGTNTIESIWNPVVGLPNRAPEITEVTASPATVSEGALVPFAVVAIDENNDPLEFNWFVDGEASEGFSRAIRENIEEFFLRWDAEFYEPDMSSIIYHAFYANTDDPIEEEDTQISALYFEIMDVDQFGDFVNDFVLDLQDKLDIPDFDNSELIIEIIQIDSQDILKMTFPDDIVLLTWTFESDIITIAIKNGEDENSVVSAYLDSYPSNLDTDALSDVLTPVVVDGSTEDSTEDDTTGDDTSEEATEGEVVTPEDGQIIIIPQVSTFVFEATPGPHEIKVEVTDGEFVTENTWNIEVGDIIEDTVSMLNILSLDVEVDNKKDRSILNGATIAKEAKPGSNVEFIVEVENLFPDTGDKIEINDIVVEVTIEDIEEDGDDISEETNDFNVDAGRDKKVRLNLKVPTEVDEESYRARIDIRGIDDKGDLHIVNWVVDLVVEKDNHDIKIRRFDLRPSPLSCNRVLTINTDLINIGSKDEDDINLEIFSPELDILKTVTGIELEEGTEDNIFDEDYTFNIDENVLPGIYPVNINIKYDDDSEEEDRTVDLTVEDCYRSSSFNQPLASDLVETRILSSTPQPQITTQLPVTEVTFRESSGYIAMLIIGVFVMIGIFIFVTALFVIKR